MTETLSSSSFLHLHRGVEALTLKLISNWANWAKLHQNEGSATNKTVPQCLMIKTDDNRYIEHWMRWIKLPKESEDSGSDIGSFLHVLGHIGNCTFIGSVPGFTNSKTVDFFPLLLLKAGLPNEDVAVSSPWGKVVALWRKSTAVHFAVVTEDGVSKTPFPHVPNLS